MSDLSSGRPSLGTATRIALAIFDLLAATALAPIAVRALRNGSVWLGWGAGLLAAAFLVAALTLLAGARVGNRVQQVLSIPLLLWVPLGTLFAAASLYVLRRPSGKGARGQSGRLTLLTYVCAIPFLALTLVLLSLAGRYPDLSAGRSVGATLPAACVEDRDTLLTEAFRYRFESPHWVRSASSFVSFEVDPTRGASADGSGSLRIDTTGPASIELARFPATVVPPEAAGFLFDLMIDDSRVEGGAELVVVLDSAAVDLVREHDPPRFRYADWHRRRSEPVYVEEGQHVGRMTLAIVTRGKGSLWVDDARLLRIPAWKDSQQWRRVEAEWEQGEDLAFGLADLHHDLIRGSSEQRERRVRTLFEVPPGGLPRPTGECYLETFLQHRELTRARLLRFGSPLGRWSLLSRHREAEVLADLRLPWGEIAHRIDSPAHLEALTAEAPGPELAHTYGARLLPVLLAQAREHLEVEANPLFDTRWSFLLTASALVSREQEGELTLPPEQKQELLAILEEDLDRQPTERLTRRDSFSLLLTLQQLDSQALERRMPELVPAFVRGDDGLREQVAGLVELAWLKPTGYADLAGRLKAAADDPDLGAFCDRLVAAVDAGENPPMIPPELYKDLEGLEAVEI